MATKTPKSHMLSAAEKKALFDKYIVPNFDFIKSLTRHYTDRYQDVDENYNYCLAQLYNYIGTYNPKQKLSTWIHICVKRAVFNQNKSRSEYASRWSEVDSIKENAYQYNSEILVDEPIGDLTDNISDSFFEILSETPPKRLSPFLLYVQGYRIREITAIEWGLGHLEKRSEDVVTSRIYWTRRELQLKLRKRGITGENYKSIAVN